MRLITWLRVENCSICQVVATPCQWPALNEGLSLSNLVSIRTFSVHFKADLLQTHAWVAVLHDTTRSATSATHALSPGRTYKTSTPASDMYHREAQMRPNKLCRRRDGWRHSARESCATTTKSSSIIEVGLPLLYNTIPIVSILCTQRSNLPFKILYNPSFFFLPRVLYVISKFSANPLAQAFYPHLLTRIRRCS